MTKSGKKIEVLGKEISITQIKNKTFISLTDMIKSKDGDFFISDKKSENYFAFCEVISNFVL